MLILIFESHLSIRWDFFIIETLDVLFNEFAVIFEIPPIKMK